ncbi:lipopolysaccharide biosynthesis protein [Brumimicrobium aurantiacum]|uniref:lipopolysaccharide biosynthesis protein n=1 Tax=Brumimicrobium aurantiacum TaxID=1737063 RepID=UPI00140205BC|nr:lipopolysaccharide biosynthesis protein [Brumimicrobium aurantiacum]
MSGTLWTLLGQFGYLGVTLIANIILARILSPEEFGQLGVVLFFIVIARVLTESGLGAALVRNNNATNTDYSTIFIFNLIISVVFCILLIATSGAISDFYDDQALQRLLIVSSFILIINAFQIIHGTRLVSNMRFKQKSKYEFFSILISSAIGIILAFNEFGIWSLVFMHLSNALIATLLMWLFEGGIGTLAFNIDSFKYHYKFGVNISLASLVIAVFDNIYQIVLAKYFSISQTGLYYQAKKLQNVPIGLQNKVTQTVFYSALSKLQEDKNKFKYMYHNMIKIISIGSGLIALIILLFAYDIILIVLGEKWVSATFFLQILSIVGFFQIQENFNRMLFKIFNDTKFVLYLELIKKIIQTITIVVGLLNHNLNILMYGFLITSILSYSINYYVASKNYSFIGKRELLINLKVFLISLLISIAYFLFSDFILLYRIIFVLLLYTVSIVLFRLLVFEDLIKFFRLLGWK